MLDLCAITICLGFIRSQQLSITYYFAGESQMCVASRYCPDCIFDCHPIFCSSQFIDAPSIPELADLLGSGDPQYRKTKPLAA